MVGNSARKGIIKRLVLTLTIAGGVLGSLVGVGGYLQGKGAPRLTSEQKRVVNDVETGKVVNLNIKESISVMSKAYEGLEKARDCLDRGDLDGALNHVINAKGFAEGVHPEFKRVYDMKGFTDNVNSLRLEIAKEIALMKGRAIP